MSGDLQHSITLVFYMLCFEIISTNSRSSTLWKLNEDKTKIVEASPFYQVSYPIGSNKAHFLTDDDPVFNIITSTVHLGKTWVKDRIEYYCTNCHTVKNIKTEKTSNSTKAIYGESTDLEEENLNCGKPVNFTHYDNLVGVSDRHKHPIVPDPHAALFFRKKTKNVQDVDVDALERKLKRAKREKPKSVQLYNQIGNFWRIKGDAEKSIECFRRALAVSPHNAEVLLNLARVLFTLQYLDDAIYLTKRSLEVQSPDKGAWQQYFTLGEIMKAYGQYDQALIHLKHSLQLKPGFEPALTAINEIEKMPVMSMSMSTFIIIIVLAMGVIAMLFYPSDSHNDFSEKPPRHFNKAMAMRSLKGIGVSQKHSRSKKTNA